MLFETKKGQLMVFAGERRIEPQDNNRKPYNLIKLVDPTNYESIEVLRSRDYSGDHPQLGDVVQATLSLEEGKYTTVSIKSMVIQK